MAKMKTAVVDRPRGIRVDESETPEIGADEVLVRVKAVGISEADVHWYKQGPDAEVAVEDYLRMQRGISGEIVGVGSNVGDRDVGQRVAVMAGYPCLKCRACRAGDFSACSQVFAVSVPPFAGAYADHMPVVSDHTWVVPDNVPYDECAMAVPLAVGFHACGRADLSVGQDVGVIGAGEMGLMCLLAARVTGAARTVVIDAYPERLGVARRLGATDVIDTGRADAVAVVDEMKGGAGLDVVFETTGRPGSLVEAIAMAGCRSVIVAAGKMPPVPTEIPPLDLIVKELDVRGVFPCAESPEPAVTVISRGMVDVRAAITERFPFEQIEDALRFADEHEEEAVKVAVEF